MPVTDVLMMIAIGIWVFIPAMIPNSTAALCGGGTCVDFGKTWKGKRILGDGKTWRGFFGGSFFGVGFGLLMIGVAALCGSDDYWGFGSFWNNVGILFCLSFGALLGDMTGAFIKRRLGMERGQKAPILDQYDFVVGSFLLTSIFHWDWVYSTYFEGYHIVALLVLLLCVWCIHRGVNIIGYRLGVKKEPW